MLTKQATETGQAALRTTAGGRTAVRSGSGTGWSTVGSGSCTASTSVRSAVRGWTTVGSRSCTSWGTVRGWTAVGSRSCTGWGTVGSRSCTSRSTTTSTGAAIRGGSGTSGSAVGGRSGTGWSTAVTTIATTTVTVATTIRWSTATRWSTAAIAAWRLDVRAASLIRVDRRAARLDDHGFTTRGSGTRRTAVGLSGTATSVVSVKQPSVSQAGHAHRGEHSTSHLDPSHRTQTPSLGKSRTWVVRTHGTQASVSRGIPGSCRSPPATRVAVQAAGCRRPVPVESTVERTSVSPSDIAVTEAPSQIVSRSQRVSCDRHTWWDWNYESAGKVRRLESLKPLFSKILTSF